MKTPIQIQISKDGTVTINVDVLKQTGVRAAAAERSSSSKTAQDLELRLMTVDDTDESKQTELNLEILAYAKKLLEANKRKELLEFLNKNKHRFNSDLKDWLKSTIESGNEK